MRPGERINAVRDRIWREPTRTRKTLPRRQARASVRPEREREPPARAGSARTFALAIPLVLVTLLPLLGTRVARRDDLDPAVARDRRRAAAADGLQHQPAEHRRLRNRARPAGGRPIVVVVENIERFLRAGVSREKAAIAATKQIRSPCLRTATLIAAFIPIFLLPGNAGKYYREFAGGGRLHDPRRSRCRSRSCPSCRRAHAVAHANPEGNTIPGRSTAASTSRTAVAAPRSRRRAARCWSRARCSRSASLVPGDRVQPVPEGRHAAVPRASRRRRARARRRPTAPRVSWKARCARARRSRTSSRTSGTATR